MIEKAEIVAWTEVGEWHKGPAAPNGCVPGQTERIIHEIRVFAADYYGRGSKLYMDGHSAIQSIDGSRVRTGPRFNPFSDGSPERIEARMARNGVSI